MTAPPATAPLGPVAGGAAYGLVIVLAVLLALWGTFLVPLRFGGSPVPVSCALALVGNALLGRAGGRLLGGLGAAGPGLVWLAVVLLLSAPRSEGDVLLPPSSLVGLLFLLVGTVTSAAVVGLAPAGADGDLRAGTAGR